MTRRAAEQRGRAATIAAWSLRLHGWQILAVGARVRGGKLGLVARRRGTLAFVDVKQRATAKAAAWSLDEYRLRRVAVAAERLSARYAKPGNVVRIDAIFVVPSRLPRHLANVWLG